MSPEEYPASLPSLKSLAEDPLSLAFHLVNSLCRTAVHTVRTPTAAHHLQKAVLSMKPGQSSLARKITGVEHAGQHAVLRCAVLITRYCIACPAFRAFVGRAVDHGGTCSALAGFGRIFPISASTKPIVCSGIWSWALRNPTGGDCGGAFFAPGIKRPL